MYPRPFPDSVVPPHHPDDVAEGKYRPSLEHLRESVERGARLRFAPKRARPLQEGLGAPPTQITSPQLVLCAPPSLDTISRTTP